MDEAHCFPDAPRYPEHTWHKLAAAAAQSRLQHRLSPANIADPTGNAVGCPYVTCELCAAMCLRGFTGHQHLNVPSSTAGCNTTANFASVLQAHDATDANPGHHFHEHGTTMLTVCSACAAADEREIGKLRCVLGLAVTEMHWLARKVQDLSPDRFNDGDTVQEVHFNTLLDKLDVLSRRLHHLHLYFQDAADAPAHITCPELWKVTEETTDVLSNGSN